MVSLDNLKTAVSAIKSEIVSKYLKKTDANNIYITKESADKSFATKSSVPKIGYFSESQDTLTNISKIRLPYVDKADRKLGTVEYNPRQYNLGDLGISGASNIGFVFNLPGEDYEDTVYIGNELDGLKPGDSVSGTFAETDSQLSNIKKVALSNTQDEYSTITKQQGTMYYNIKIVNRFNYFTKMFFKLSASSNSISPRLQGMTYGHNGGLYYFISDEISNDSTLNIPFTITRIDGRYEKLPNPNPIHVVFNGKDQQSVTSEITYDGTEEEYVHIYPDAINVKLSLLGDLYYSDLTYANIWSSQSAGRCVFATYSDGSLDYILQLAYINRNTNKCIFIGPVDKSDYDATFMMFKGNSNGGSDKLHGSIETYTVPILTDGGIIINSSTTGSTKKFKITADDSGTPSLISTVDGSKVWSGEIPAKTSQLTNDSGYLTLATLPKYGGESE